MQNETISNNTIDDENENDIYEISINDMPAMT